MGRSLRVLAPLMVAAVLLAGACGRIPPSPSADRPAPSTTVAGQAPPGPPQVSTSAPSVHPTKSRHRPRHVKGKPVYLTFDDGPSSTYTPQVLKLLKAYHAHAVFCEIGLQVQAHPQVTRKVVAAGDTLCDHTFDHDEHLPLRSLATITSDIGGGLKALQHAAPDAGVAFYRAPGGAWSRRVRAVARHAGMASLTWTIDTEDWTRPGVTSIERAVRQGLRPHAVVLMHDGGGPREQTIAALAQLLPELKTAGYRFAVPPRSMFNHRPGHQRE